MASQVSPGVVIRERDLSTGVLTGVSALRAAIASTFTKGPVGKIVNIGSERELIDTFGAPAEANSGDWLVASEFLRYGGQLAVVRATTGVLNATLSGSGVLVGTKEAFDAGVTTEKFAARDAGAAGNNLRVVIVDKVADSKMTKAGHGLSVGDALSDGTTTDHEVTVVIDANTVGIKHGAAAAVSGNGFTQAAFSNSDWNALPIASTGLTYKNIGPRPGTSAFASERYLSADEVHVAVIDETTNTIVERMTYLSKLTDAKSPEGASLYWKDYVNEYSGYIYAGSALTSAEFTPVGEDPGAASSSYGATAAAPKTLAYIFSTAGGALSGGTDDYAYTAAEITTAYNLFLDTEATSIDFVLMGGNGANETDTRTKAAAVAAIANGRKDCIAFVSPWTGDQVATSGGTALTPAAQLANTIEFMDTIHPVLMLLKIVVSSMSMIALLTNIVMLVATVMLLVSVFPLHLSKMTGSLLQV